VTQNGKVSTLAGGEEGFANGQGYAAKFNLPYGITIDAAGNLYVTEIRNDRIRKITPKGEVSSFVGGEEGFADGEGSVAQFRSPRGIAIDAAGNLYVADSGNHSIRKVTPEGVVSTLAGGEEGFADGQGSAAKFSLPFGITIGTAGNLYVTDGHNHRIRKVTPKGEVSTLAGSGEHSFADGQGSVAKFNAPYDITIDTVGNLYVADSGNHGIRKITPKGEVSTLAGGEYGFGDGRKNHRFAEPHGIAIDTAGNLYVADTQNHRIRKIKIHRP